MEGAGASMEGHLPEHRIWKTDSSDIKLPFDVEDVLWRYGDIPIPWLPTLSGPESQVRLGVLEAIGNCNTYRNLFVEGDISRFTASEWEIVLRGFMSSTALRSLSVQSLTWTSVAEVESLCSQLGTILSTSSVTEVWIEDCSLSSTCFLNLASGLRESAQSKLNFLQVWNAWADTSALKQVADMINSAARLETLCLGGEVDRMIDMDEEATRALSQALIQSSSLKTLKVRSPASVKGGVSALKVRSQASVNCGVSALMLNAFAGDGGNRSIDRLQLIGVSGLGNFLPELFTSNRSLKEVEFTAMDVRPEQWALLCQSIRVNSTATTINVVIFKDGISGAALEEIEELACAASSDVKDPVLHLQIYAMDYDVLLSAFNHLGRILRGEFKSVKSFDLFPAFSSTSGSNQKRIKCIHPKLRNTGGSSDLNEQFWWMSQRIEKGIWKELLRCLRGNTSVTTLDLFFRHLEQEEFMDLMELLQVNLTIQDVSKTPWGTDGKAALIQAALKQNQKRALFMSVFREAKLAFGDAKAGRLFLCGSPRAGKTQLRRTLMRIIQGKSWIGNKRDELWRIKGIEVEFLQNNDKMQISIWDLAGHWIFRTLQTVLFPQTNDFCVFLFVYSPFCEETSSPKQESCFRTELEGWLTFIASSTKVTGHNLPEVLVVISHKDKMTSRSLTWARSTVEELRKVFSKCVDLRPIEECFYVDARKKKQVIPLKNHIFDIFDNLLSEKSPQVPQLCFQLSSLLLSNIKENKTCPLWPLEKFHEFCSPILKQFIPLSSAHSVDHSKILSSVVSYLNDVGSIIYIPNLDHIVVDPNWLTNSFLDDLIAMGQHFQAQESKDEEKMRSSDSYTSKDGFVSESVFSRLMDTFLEKQSRIQNGDREVLEKIFFNLDLCFKLEDTSQYFIPSFIPEEDRVHVESMTWDSKVATSQFVGIRIQCEDLKTMTLTVAFFPRFQVLMRRKLISEMHVSKETVTFSRHYLRLYLDGHQIYVEHVQSEKSHNYVDVLMLCSKHKSKEVAIKYALKLIVQELISFCASSNGCPGVALVLGVIQTMCVEMLIPIHLRGAILIEELKSKFSININDRLGIIGLDWSQSVEEELLHYEYTWPPIQSLRLNATFERATNLLWESDVNEIRHEIRQKRIQQLESLQQSLQQSLNNDLAQSHSESENTDSNLSLPNIKDFNPASAKCLTRASTSVEYRSPLPGNNIDLLVQKIDGLDERFILIESIVQGLDVKMGYIVSLQRQLQSTLSTFMSEVDRIIGYSELHQQSRTPKRPYITNDVGFFYRMSASLHLGTTVRLRLMCESVTGFHTVKDQEGLKLRLDRENSGWIPTIIEISYKVLYYAVKTGVDVILGVGQAIPDWDALKTDIVKLDSISDIDRSAIQKGGHSEQLNETWLRIQQTLAPQLKDSFSRIFNLYLVKYVGPQNGGHAWVCADCMHKAKHAGSLTF